MYRILFLSFFALLFSQLAAQTQLNFTSIDDFTVSAKGISDHHFIDVNNDTYPDLVISFEDELDSNRIYVYRNNGRGQFHERIPNKIQGIHDANLWFGDIDSDGDQDLFVSGRYASWSQSIVTTHLYLNNGGGRFSRDTINTFNGLTKAYQKFLIDDFDKDGDNDVVMSGLIPYSGDTLFYYENTGSSNFQLKLNHNLISLNLSDMISTDYDSDGDLDILIYGGSSNSNLACNLFTNNGSGVFSQTTNQFPPVDNGNMVFGDLNGDNYEDLLIVGRGAQHTYFTAIFINDSVGNFTYQGILDSNLIGFNTKIVDIDGDSDLDILTLDNLNGIVYLNGGAGQLTKSYPFNSLHQPKFSSPADLDSDGRLDVVFLSFERMYQVYFQKNSMQFELQTGDHILNVIPGEAKLLDLNNDTLLDVVVAGRDSDSEIEAYINQGDFTFKKIFRLDTNQLNPQVYISSGDVNGDGFVDILVGGVYGSKSTILLLNDSGRSMHIDTNLVLPLSLFPHANLFDIDGDNDLDILFQGKDYSTDTVNEVYVNNGLGIFSIDSVNYDLPEIIPAKTLHFDVDGDNDLDLVMSGDRRSPISIENFLVYKNNGSGFYSRFSNRSIDEVLDFADYDNDGDIDILGVRNQIIQIFENDSNGVFATPNNRNHLFKHPASGFVADDARFFDADSDGDIDIIIAGHNNSLHPRLFLNDSVGVYTEWTERNPFYGARRGKIDYGDIDNDGDNDLIIVGEYSAIPRLTKIYENRLGPIKFDTTNYQVCAKFISPSGKLWNQSGTYLDTIQSLSFTDSIITFNLNVFPLNTNIHDSLSFLYSPSTDTLQWLDCQNGYLPILGETSQVFIPPSSGSYAIEVKSANCIDTSACYPFIITDVAERSIGDLIMVYPNPNQGRFTIYNGSDSNLDYEVFSASGKLMRRGFMRRMSMIEKDFELSSGLYFIVFLSGDDKWTKKVMVD